MRAKLAWAPLTAVVVLTAGGPFTTAEDRTSTAITDIRQESNERSTRLVVECTGPLAYTYYSPDPLTLVVDIPEVDASRIPPKVAVGSREVESVRVTNMARADGRNLARLEVRLASLVPYQIYSKGKALNLIFERPANAAARPAEPAALPASTPVPEPQVRASAPELTAPQVEEARPEEARLEEARLVEAATPEAATPPAATPAPSAAPAPAKTPKLAATGPKATRIVSVTQQTEAGELAVTVKADGRLKYQDFFLGNPDRLVVDFADVLARAQAPSVDGTVKPVKKVRLGQFSAASPRVARLVLDLSARAPYRIVEGSDGVKIVFGEGQTTSPEPFAALRPLVAPVAPAAPLVISPAPAPLALPALPEPQITTKAPPDASLPQDEKKYIGAPISLDFKDGDLQDIFRLFSDISGSNVVVNPGVSGKVTLKLQEVPWDQALDLILKTNGLGSTVENNVIRIARLSDLQKEEQDRRKLADEKALAGDLFVVRKRLSYAKAGELEATVKKVALSARGNITLDTRTNTMIITDLDANIKKANDLIADLDRATPQVEIEARIVVTSRDFTRELGIQWGFNHEQSMRYGNTTNLAFPNSIIINGNATPSGGTGIAADQNGQAVAGAGFGAASRGYAVNLPASSFNSGIGISLGNVLGSFSLDAALTALERQGRGRLISTPKITTQNNQEATIKQGQQIPIQTTANNTVTVQFKDAVLTLKVTPQITDAGTVILTVDVSNDSADFSRQINGIPPINTQQAKTQVLVKDGATAVIGGIYQSNETSSQSRTPFLGEIPLLGYLFRNRGLQTRNQELLLFITPRIVKS